MRHSVTLATIDPSLASAFNHQGRLMILAAVGVIGNAAHDLAWEPMRCQCNETATHVGLFRNLTPGRRGIFLAGFPNAMWLCRSCAAECDRGMVVVRLNWLDDTDDAFLAVKRQSETTRTQ